MPISKDLFLAILAMDSYNRGYDAGIGDEDSGDPDCPGKAGSIVGGAIVSDDDLPTGSETAGFYGIACELQAGERTMAWPRDFLNLQFVNVALANSSNQPT